MDKYKILRVSTILFLFLWSPVIAGSAKEIPSRDRLQPDPRKEFVAGALLWHAPWDDAEKIKNLIDNYFQLLEIDVLYLLPGGRYAAFTEENKKWWDGILSFCQRRGYKIAIGNMVHGGGWGEFGTVATPSLLKYISNKYPEVVWGIGFGETLADWFRFVGRSHVYSPFKEDIPYESHVLRPETENTIFLEAEDIVNEKEKIREVPLSFLPLAAFGKPRLKEEHQKNLVSGQKVVFLIDRTSLSFKIENGGRYKIFIRGKGGKVKVSILCMGDRVGEEIFKFNQEHYTYLRSKKSYLLREDMTLVFESIDRTAFIDCISLVPEGELSQIPYFYDGWLSHSWSEYVDALEQSYFKTIEICARAAPNSYILLIEPYTKPPLSYLRSKDYASRIIILGEYWDNPILDLEDRHEEFVKNGQISGWGYYHGGQGFHYESPIHFFFDFVIPILHGANVISGGDTFMWWRRLFNNGTSREASLTDYGIAFRQAIRFAHKYKIFKKDLDVSLALIPPPIRVRHRYFTGHLRSTWDGIDSLIIRDLKRAKVVLLDGSGIIDEYTYEDLKEFVEEGGILFLSLGGFVHSPDGTEVIKYPSREQMRIEWIKDLCGFDFKGWKRINKGEVKVEDTSFPLFEEGYSEVSKGAATIAIGEILEGSKTVVSFNGQPRVIVCRRGKGYVYTVLNQFLDVGGNFWENYLGPKLKQRYGYPRTPLPELYIDCWNREPIPGVYLLPFTDGSYFLANASKGAVKVRFKIKIPRGARYIKMERHTAFESEPFCRFIKVEGKKEIQEEVVVPYGHILIYTPVEKEGKPKGKDIYHQKKISLVPNLYIRHLEITVPLWVLKKKKPIYKLDISSYFNFNTKRGFDREGRNFAGALPSWSTRGIMRWIFHQLSQKDYKNRPWEIDCIVPQGQTIKIPAKEKYKAVYFLGASVDGNQQGKIKITYLDGSYEEKILGLSDWLSEIPSYGEISAVCGYRIKDTNGKIKKKLWNIWMQGIDIDETKMLRAITLPVNENMRIFAISLQRANVDTIKR